MVDMHTSDLVLFQCNYNFLRNTPLDALESLGELIKMDGSDPVRDQLCRSLREWALPLVLSKMP